MNINKIIKSINELSGKKLKIKVNIGRNKYEYYEGHIKSIYSNLFTVETNKGIKTWTYSDVATKVVTLTKFN